jgi:hypothetical protein
MGRLNIQNFPLAWRWTQASHAVLPPDVLDSLTALENHEAEHFYSLGEEIFRRDTTSAITYKALQASDTTPSWLRALTIPATAQVIVAWNKQDAISLPWQTFIEYWDDFCYPNSDDAFVFPTEGTGVLAWNHYEVFEFIGNAV